MPHAYKCEKLPGSQGTPGLAAPAGTSSLLTLTAQREGLVSALCMVRQYDSLTPSLSCDNRFPDVKQVSIKG